MNLIMFHESVEAFHRKLNRPDVVPAKGYRRNAIPYPVISYVNMIIGLYLSQNYEVIPTFLRRALEHINSLKTEATKLYEQDVLYYQTVLDYLRLMAHFIVSLDHVDDFCKRMIPEELLATSTRNNLDEE